MMLSKLPVVVCRPLASSTSSTWSVVCASLAKLVSHICLPF